MLWSKIAFDHMFDHLGKNPSILYPGVAQLVGRLVWDQDAASSSLATRTKRSESPFGGSGLLLCMGRDSNSLPRKILGYKTPDEAFEAEMDAIYSA